jgi:hypothetical protein
MKNTILMLFELKVNMNQNFASTLEILLLFYNVHIIIFLHFLLQEVKKVDYLGLWLKTLIVFNFSLKYAM